MSAPCDGANTQGFFLLESPQTVQSTNPRTGNPVNHYHYRTWILTQEGRSLRADLRQYATGTGPSPDGSMSDVFARFVFPQGASPSNPGVPFLDAIDITPFGGDPDADDYDTNIPSVPQRFHPIGQVLTDLQPLDDGPYFAFRVRSAAWVRDGIQEFQFLAAFDRSNPRWARSPTPYPGSRVRVSGPVLRVGPDGTWIILIKDISLLGGTQQPSTASAPTLPVTPRKRKFGGDHEATPSPSSSIRTNPSPAAILPYSTTQQPSPTPSTNPASTFGPPSVTITPSDADVFMAPASPVHTQTQYPPVGYHPPPSATLAPPPHSTPATAATPTKARRQTKPRASRATASQQSTSQPSPSTPPLIESNALPPISSFTSSLTPAQSHPDHGSAASTYISQPALGGITIHEPYAHLSAKQRGKLRDPAERPNPSDNL